MARSRRGSFGLQPRVVPNVSSQIIALAREYVAKRDQLIMDAWRSGGTFEGKQATDEMVLAYWKERREGLDKGDPTYEQASNQVLQLTYAIEQSKQDLLHLQGRISDAQYAQFFIRWSRKVPKNSEFYRVLQKDAAQLIESSKAQSRASAEAAKAEAFNKFVEGTTARDIAIGDAMTKALDALSKETGLSITGNGAELLALLTKEVEANPNEYRALIDTINKGDPNWNGQFTEGYFSARIDAAVKGYDLIADRAQKQGYVSAYANATQGMSNMSQWGQNINVWPVAQTYSTAENALLRVWGDPNASQMDKIEAASRTAAAYESLANTPGVDAGTRTMLLADAARLRGEDAGDAPSFGTSMLGRPGVSPEMAMQVGAWVQTKAQMDANPLAWAYGPVDASGNYDATGKGAFGMVPAGQVPPGAQAVMVPGYNGQAVMAMVVPHAVYAVDPNNPNGNPKLAGYQITYNIGGKPVQLWGYKDEKGGNHWSLVSPLAEGSATRVDTNGDVFVTPPTSPDINAQLAGLKDSNGNPIQLTDQQRASLAAGGSITTTNDTSDRNKAGVKTVVTISAKDGWLVSKMTTSEIDATGNVVSSTTTPSQLTAPSETGVYSPSRLSAGEIPGVTYSSPMQASVSAAAYTQTQDQVGRMASDPAVQQAFLSQTMQTLGITNPYDPRIATAWKEITSPSNGTVAVGRVPMDPRMRRDLNMPGTTPNPDAYTGQLTVNFGKSGELNLPGLPSYLGQQQVNLSPLGDAVSQAQGILGNLLPGLGAIPQTPTGSPTPTVTPTAPGPTPVSTKPGVAPTTVTPTAPSAPTPAPTPLPKPKPPPGGGPKPL